jgi:hypothetical protein
MEKKVKPKVGFIRDHSLSIASILIVMLWIVLYNRSDPSKHFGSFFGNAIADWTGVVVTVLASRYLRDRQIRKKSKIVHGELHWMVRWLVEHPLTVFLAITGIGWVILFAHMDPNSRWGQVVGNIVSEWTQIFGLVLLTKKLIERGTDPSLS